MSLRQGVSRNPVFSLLTEINVTISLTIRAIRALIVIPFVFAMICAPAWADRLQESFNARADSLAAVLIAERAGPDSAAIYRTLQREEKTTIFNQLLATAQSRSTAILLRVSHRASLPDGIRRFF